MPHPTNETPTRSVPDLLAGDVAVVVDSRDPHAAEVLSVVQDQLAAAGVRSLRSRTVDDVHPLADALDDLLDDAPDLLLLRADDRASTLVAGRLARTGTVLGLLPPDPSSVAATLADPVVVDVDLGRAGRRPFRHEAVLGLPVGVTDRLTPSLERRFGRLARPVATMRAHRRSVRFQVRLEFPDGDHPRLDLDDVLQVSVRPRAGVLDVHCVQDMRLRDALGVDRRLRRGDVVEHERVHHLTTSAVRVVTRPNTEVQLDGVVETLTPLVLTLQRDALRMLVPA